MKIGNENLNEIITGAFISEDKKTLVLDVFTFTNLDRSMSDDVIADNLGKCINDDCLKVYSDTVENIVFSCGEYLILKPNRISVDVENLRVVFSKLRAIACGSEIQLPNVLPVGIKVVDNYIIDDLACQAEEEGLKEKAEFFYRWEAVVDYYWGNYHLGQFLQKNNQAEFEECYKKIAGENDWFGDATSEYGVWLHKQGRYSEAIKYLMYATRALVDTCNREYAMSVLCDSISQDCPYWEYFDEANFIKYLVYYLESDSTRDNSDIEKVLLQRASSENENIVLTAKDQLSRLASTGVFLIENGENGYCDIFDYVKMKKAKEILSIEIEEDYDVEGMVSDLYYAFDGELDEKIAKAFENRLLAVECSEEFDYEGAGFSKIVLFQLYFDGKYADDQITLVAPSLMDKQKLAALFRYEFVMNTEINFTFELARDEGDLDDILELAYSLYPEKDLIVRNWVERCAIKGDTDKLVAIINATKEKLASYIALDLFDEWNYYFECEDEECSAENIEKILIALSDKGLHREFLLSLYQFGTAKLQTDFDEIEVVREDLKNMDKAKAYSKKYGLEFLDEPAEIEN